MGKHRAYRGRMTMFVLLMRMAFATTLVMTVAPALIIWFLDSNATLTVDQMMPTNDVGQHYTLSNITSVPDLLYVLLIGSLSSLALIAAGVLRRR